MFIVAERLGMTVGELGRRMPGAELMLWAEHLTSKDSDGG